MSDHRSGHGTLEFSSNGEIHSHSFSFSPVISMGKLLCFVLYNWERGDAIGEKETAAHFARTVQAIHL